MIPAPPMKIAKKLTKAIRWARKLVPDIASALFETNYIGVPFTVMTERGPEVYYAHVFGWLEDEEGRLYKSWSEFPIEKTRCISANLIIVHSKVVEIESHREVGLGLLLLSPTLYGESEAHNRAWRRAGEALRKGGISPEEYEKVIIEERNKLRDEISGGLLRLLEERPDIVANILRCEAIEAYIKGVDVARGHVMDVKILEKLLQLYVYDNKPFMVTKTCPEGMKKYLQVIASILKKRWEESSPEERKKLKESEELVWKMVRGLNISWVFTPPPA